MNVYDSEQIARVLAPAGFTSTPFLEDADLVIVNTCAIRAKAEQKAFSFIGRLAKVKRKRPGMIIGVAGCVAQQEGEKILTRMPIVDLVFGTHAIPRLPELVGQVSSRRQRLVDVEMGAFVDEIEAVSGFRNDGQVNRFVTIMQGCDNFCAYCVVPHTRGREMSRHPDRIVSEIKNLVGIGAREVTLLGQNVNSYGRKEGLCSFPELLRRINTVEGLERIRFTTSHPKDLSEELIRAFGELDKLCHHIHLPVQSGSDRVLKRMNRKYDSRTYRDRIEQLRALNPGIAVTSDVIVGFPGETRADFEATVSLVREVAFDGLFAFMYSDRSVAPASRFEDKVSEAEKKSRLQELLAYQEAVTLQKHHALLGSVQRILVEEQNTRASDGEAGPGARTTQWTGRTGTNRIVNFDHSEGNAIFDRLRPGSLVDVQIGKAFSHSLRGVPVDIEPFVPEETGGIHYVA